MDALPSGKWKKYASASSLGMASRFMPFPGRGARSMSGEAGCSHTPCVLRGNCIKSHTEERLRHGLKQFHHLGANLYQIGKEIVVANAGKASFFWSELRPGR